MSSNSHHHGVHGVSVNCSANAGIGPILGQVHEGLTRRSVSLARRFDDGSDEDQVRGRKMSLVSMLCIETGMRSMAARVRTSAPIWLYPVEVWLAPHLSIQS